MVCGGEEQIKDIRTSRRFGLQKVEACWSVGRYLGTLTRLWTEMSGPEQLFLQPPAAPLLLVASYYSDVVYYVAPTCFTVYQLFVKVAGTVPTHLNLSCCVHLFRWDPIRGPSKVTQICMDIAPRYLGKVGIYLYRYLPGEGELPPYARYIWSRLITLSYNCPGLRREAKWADQELCLGDFDPLSSGNSYFGSPTQLTYRTRILAQCARATFLHTNGLDSDYRPNFFYPRR